MKVNFDEMESGMNFKEGQRYTLIVDSAKEVFGETKGTPGLELELVTEDGDNAYKHTVWLSPKALFRAQAWFQAMGLPTDGEVEINVARLPGIKLSVKCVYEKYTDANGKKHTSTKWDEPLKVGPSGTLEKMAAGTDRKKKEEANDDVPF